VRIRSVCVCGVIKFINNICEWVFGGLHSSPVLGQFSRAGQSGVRDALDPKRILDKS
jgi:hypothetical protein